MLAGSMIRWDSIAAKPKSYDENGKAIKPKTMNDKEVSADGTKVRLHFGAV